MKKRKGFGDKQRMVISWEQKVWAKKKNPLYDLTSFVGEQTGHAFNKLLKRLLRRSILGKKKNRKKTGNAFSELKKSYV